MLSVQNLEVVYQDVILVLRGVSFEIPKGKIVALLGSNGSGKTTLLRIICGLTKPSKGDLDISTDAKITFLGHKNALKQYLTIEDNLSLLNLIHHPNLDQFLQKFGLDGCLDLNLASLSFGQQKKIALLRIFLNDSNLLIMDEPCVGLDNQTQNYLSNFINDELKLGKSVLFSSHIDLDINSDKLNLS